MVSSLPNELILDILELAANASPASALNLCLLSSNIARSIRPILYRKVVLLHDTQVPSFAWTLVPAAHRALPPHAHAHALGLVHQPEHRVLHGHEAGRDDVRGPGGAGVLGRLAVGPGCTRTKAGEAHWLDSDISSVFAYSTRMRYRFPK